MLNSDDTLGIWTPCSYEFSSFNNKMSLLIINETCLKRIFWPSISGTAGKKLTAINHMDTEAKFTSRTQTFAFNVHRLQSPNQNKEGW